MWRELTLPSWVTICSHKCDGNHHYNDVIMGAIASQITSITVVYSTVYSGADQRKHDSSAFLAFVRGIHRGPLNSLHKWPVTRKMFDDVIMLKSKETQKKICCLYHQSRSCRCPSAVNRLRPRRSCRHFADDIFKIHFHEWWCLDFA